MRFNPSHLRGDAHQLLTLYLCSSRVQAEEKILGENSMHAGRVTQKTQA